MRYRRCDKESEHSLQSTDANGLEILETYWHSSAIQKLANDQTHRQFMILWEQRLFNS